MAPRLLITIRSGPSGVLGRVRLAGRTEGGRGVPLGRPRRYDAYALMYVLAGCGRYRDASQDVALSAGDLVSVVPGHPHWYGPVDGQTWDELFVVFEGPVFELAAASGLIDVTRPVRRIAPGPLWAHRLDSFRTRRVPRTPAGRDREACELLALLADLHAGADPEPDGRGDWFTRSQELLEADLGEPLALPGVAAAVGIPYETWRRHFRYRAGVSPARYRRLHRLSAAAALLSDTALTTREIAATLGFSDEHHLARQFRAATGRSPRQHRNATG
jgi:AraC-like DNA-binding protein